MSRTFLKDFVKFLEKCSSLESIKRIHAQIIINGLHGNNFLAVKLVTICGQFLEDISYARLIFDDSLDSANVFLWTSIITAYSKHQSQVTAEAIFIYRKMCQYGIQPNSYTLSSVLKACSFLSSVLEGTQVHTHTIKLGLDQHIYVQTTLVDMYAKLGLIQSSMYLFETMPEKNVVSCNAIIVSNIKCGNVVAARKIFDEMGQRDSISWTAMLSGYINIGNFQAAKELFAQIPQKDVTSWNALIAAFSHCGEWHEALSFFQKMHSERIEPNQVTMSVVISVCGHLGALEMAKEMHKYLVQTGMEINVHIFNSLIDMYAKCGSVDEAFKVFQGMPRKDTVSYNAMIVGLANHGLGKGAVKLFSKMLVCGLQPDGVTFLGVLTACSHSGLLVMGRQVFNCLINVFSVNPSADHYACMVDLLGRAGCIREAYELVKTMTVEPHAGVWGALLNACRNYCNIDIAKIAAQKLFLLEPENPGNYVLLANIFARAHMWDDVSDIRREMRGKGVAKTAGCSWIEVNDEVHKFLIGHTTHRQYPHIYRILKFLSSQLVLNAHIP